MIRLATIHDCKLLANMAIKMWNDHTIESLTNEFFETLQDENNVFFIKFENDTAIGFAQCSLRHDYVEGTCTSPVGYLEGIFVEEYFRHNGYAKELLLACQNWAKSKGCTEFASDCEITNTDSLAFHLSLGFEEADRIICFTKKL